MSVSPSVCAVIVTFNRKDELLSGLVTLSSQTRPPNHILVVDNCSTDGTADAVGREFPEVEVLRMPENLGPAGGHARGIQGAWARGFDWIWWQDDDDPPERPNLLERLLADGERLRRQGVPLAGIAISGARFDWSTGRMTRVSDRELRAGGLVPVDCVAGGSQLLLHRSVVDAVGLPAGELFFCYEDLEYCLRMRARGLALFVPGDLWYEHRHLHGRLGWKKPLVPPQGDRIAWRQYYSTRNYIHMMLRTFGRPDLAARYVVRSFGAVGLAFVLDPSNAIALTRVRVRGILDAYSGKLGRTVAPVQKS